MERITEGRAVIDYYPGKISKELDVFYNPIMKHNRDISILLLNRLKKRDMQICLPLAGTGIRVIRFALELDSGIVSRIAANDISAEATELIKKNCAGNSVESVEVTTLDANECMLASKGFDYIDIDPFGSPNMFLDAAVKRLSRDGILAITATDTSALCGTYPKSCMRKYWARPLRNELMHEIGIRILIRKVQLIGVQMEKALQPIYSYSKDHYFRIFFRCAKGKKRCDEVVRQHASLVFCEECMAWRFVDSPIGAFLCKCDANRQKYAGPLYTGRLWDPDITDLGLLEENDHALDAFQSLIHAESKVAQPFFYQLPAVCKRFTLSKQNKFQLILEELEKKGYAAVQSHFALQSIRTDAPPEAVCLAINSK